MKKLIFSIVALTVLLSCNTPKVMRYYKSEKESRIISADTILINNLFEINAFTLDPSVANEKSIFDLSNRAQSALIESLNSKSKATEELMAAITSPLDKATSPDATKGSISWKKRVVINIDKKDTEVANRFQQIWLIMEIPDNLKDKVEFVNWDKIITETQTFDLGKITSNNTSGFSFSPEVTMGGFIEGKLPGVVSGSSTFGEEKSITRKLAGLNAAVVTPHKFILSRQASPNENISGNIVIELTLKSKLAAENLVYNFDGLYLGTTAVEDQAKITLNKSLVIKPDFGENSIVPIDLTYKFHYRTVGKGKRTEPEYDDHITYLNGQHTDSSKFNLFDGADSKPIIWRISDGSNYLHIVDSTEQEALQFDSYNKASQLLNWIKLTNNFQISNYSLYLGLRPLKNIDIKNLMIQPVN